VLGGFSQLSLGVIRPPFTDFLSVTEFAGAGQRAVLEVFLDHAVLRFAVRVVFAF